MRARVRWLLEPESGIVGQVARYAITGGIVSFVYLSTTSVLAVVAGVPFQIALPIGFLCGLVIHFTLQRAFVWAHRDAFALPLRHQVGRYLTLAGGQYGATAASTSLLPAALGLPTELVFLPTAALVTLTNFLLFRHRVFHAKMVAAEIVQPGR